MPNEQKTPKDFTWFPTNSLRENWESEQIAQNIMRILARTGNTWRSLPWSEYKSERLKDGNFTQSERGFFDEVVKYTESPERAQSFSPSWRDW